MKTDLNDDIQWVMDFNINLGIGLGGLLQVMQAFENQVALMKSFCDLVKHDMKNASHGMTANERAENLQFVVNGIRKTRRQDAYLLEKYWEFFSDACDRIVRNPAFANWIDEGREFQMYPEIFTYEILRLANKTVGRHGQPESNRFGETEKRCSVKTPKGCLSIIVVLVGTLAAIAGNFLL